MFDQTRTSADALKQRFPNQTNSSITSIDFDDTGELCLVAQDDETLQIYNCKEGKHGKELKSQKYGVDLARFTHHSQSVIFASTKGDDAIRYLSTHDNAFLRYFRGHTAPVTSLTLNPSNDTFLSSSLDNTLRLWDLRSSSCQGLLHLTQPLLTAYDPTASVIAVASPAAKAILLYDVRNYDKPPFASFDLSSAEEAMARIPAVSKAGGNGANKWTKLEFSNDGARMLLATAGAGHYIIDAFEGEFVCFLLRSGGATGRLPPVELKNLRAQQAAAIAAKRAPGSVSPGSGQGDACFTPDGKFVVSGAGGEEVLVFRLPGSNEGATGDRILQPVKELAGGNKMGSQNAVVAFNPRFNHFAAGSRHLVFWVPDLE